MGGGPLAKNVAKSAAGSYARVSRNRKPVRSVDAAMGQHSVLIDPAIGLTYVLLPIIGLRDKRRAPAIYVGHFEAI